jgi:hypothetical protein
MNWNSPQTGPSTLVPLFFRVSSFSSLLRSPLPAVQCRRSAVIRANAALVFWFRDFSRIGRRADVKNALVEGFNWLEQAGLIGLSADDSSQYNYFVTRRGRKLRSIASIEAFKLKGLLSTGNLDPELAEKAVHLFTRGGYEAAIFQAYKIVEVRVRKIGNLGDESYDIDLMRDAFNPARGSFRDPKRTKEAL